MELGYEESRYASPLPSPDDLERYKDLIPDAPERLLAVGEREQTHRHRIEDRLAAIDEEAMPKFYGGQRRGQILGFLAALAYLGLMLAVVLIGHSFVGVGGALAGIAALVWALRRSPTGTDDSAPATVEPIGGDADSDDSSSTT